MIEDILFDFTSTFIIGEKNIDNGVVDGFFFDNSGFIYNETPTSSGEVYF